MNGLAGGVTLEGSAGTACVVVGGGANHWEGHVSTSGRPLASSPPPTCTQAHTRTWLHLWPHSHKEYISGSSYDPSHNKHTPHAY
jgi:hypothetical protein